MNLLFSGHAQGRESDTLSGSDLFFFFAAFRFSFCLGHLSDCFRESGGAMRMSEAFRLARARV